MCDYGTGPLGSLGDGCHDAAEGTTVAVLTVATAAAVVATYRSGGCACGLPLARTVRITALAVLAMSSAYHIAFGEDWSDTAPDGFRAAVNTRDHTVPVQTAVIATVWLFAAMVGRSWAPLAGCGCCVCVPSPTLVAALALWGAVIVAVAAGVVGSRLPGHRDSLAAATDATGLAAAAFGLAIEAPGFVGLMFGAEAGEKAADELDEIEMQLIPRRL